MFILFLPYQVDVPMQRWPWMNWVLIGVTVAYYITGSYLILGMSLVLGRGPLGWLGHMLVHADLWHLLGNMLFLWVFGNAVCAKVGNAVYLALYFALGFFAGIVSYVIDPSPSIGASGAINGVMGMYVVWYLLNDVSCLYIAPSVGLPQVDHFSISSYWMILAWMVFDIIGVFWGDSGINYICHLAGLAGGFALAITMLKMGWVEMDPCERSLLQVLSGDE